MLTERKRQIEREGWTPEHDDNYLDFEMARAASCYAKEASTYWMDRDPAQSAPKNWPWDEVYWKPKGARPDLVRAGALILAEIERLDRLPTPPQEQEG